MAVAPMNDIPILYVNKTDRNDFMVVVFTKNEDSNAIDTPFVAWHTLKAQTSASFTYPVDAAVGAYWEKDSVICRAGPLPSNLGSTWEMRMSTVETSPHLSEVVTAPINPGNTIVVRNMKPTTWSGQPFNFGLYKSGKLLVTQHDVGVGSQAVFQLTPKLYFGVVKDIRIGSIFKSLTTTQSFFCVNLNDFANGLVVNLDMNPASGEFFFAAEHP